MSLILLDVNFRGICVNSGWLILRKKTRVLSWPLTKGRVISNYNGNCYAGHRACPDFYQPSLTGVTEPCLSGLRVWLLRMSDKNRCAWCSNILMAIYLNVLSHWLWVHFVLAAHQKKQQIPDTSVHSPCFSLSLSLSLLHTCTKSQNYSASQ